MSCFSCFKPDKKMPSRRIESRQVTVVNTVSSDTERPSRNLVRIMEDAPATASYKKEIHMFGIQTDSMNKVDWQQWHTMSN